MPTKKTQGYLQINVKDPEILSVKDILEKIFFKKPFVAEKAEKLLNKIAKREVNSSNYKKIAEELNLPLNSYYYLLKRMRAVGLVYRIENEYRLSETFSEALENMANYWRGWVKRKRRRRY